ILEEPFQTLGAEAFVAHPYWGEAHVGLGPYRVDRWELGAFIEGASFDGHATGPPKIPRIKLVFMADSNTVVANLLSGAVHTSDDRAIRFQQGMVLKNEWVARGVGTVILSPKEVRFTLVQF